MKGATMYGVDKDLEKMEKALAGMNPVKVSIDYWTESSKQELDQAKFNFFSILKSMLVHDLMSRDEFRTSDKDKIERTADKILNGERYRILQSSSDNTVYDSYLDSLALKLIEASRRTKDNSCLFLNVPSELYMTTHLITREHEEKIRSSQIKNFLKIYPDIATGDGSCIEVTVKSKEELRDVTRSFLTDENIRAHRKIIFFIGHGMPGKFIFRNKDCTEDLNEYFEFVDKCLDKLNHKPITHIVGAQCHSHTGDPKYYSSDCNLRVQVLALANKHHQYVHFDVDMGFESNLLELNQFGRKLVDHSRQVVDTSRVPNDHIANQCQSDNLKLKDNRSSMRNVRTRISRFFRKIRRPKYPIQETDAFENNDNENVIDSPPPAMKKRTSLSRFIRRCQGLWKSRTNTGEILSQPCQCTDDNVDFDL